MPIRETPNLVRQNKNLPFLNVLCSTYIPKTITDDENKTVSRGTSPEQDRILLVKSAYMRDSIG